MNAAKMTLTATVLATALGLALGLMAAPAAQANPADQNGCHTHKSCSAGDGDTTPGNGSIPLVFTLADTVPANLENDGGGNYVHKEGKVRALAGGPSGRFPSLLLGLLGVGKDPRTLKVLPQNCTNFAFIDGSHSNCADVPDGLLGVERGHVYLALRPYAVDCPDELPDGFCPGIFTMDNGPDDMSFMSFMVRFDEGLTIEVASNMGGGAPNPGFCLSLLSDADRHAYLNDACPADLPEECNVTVTANSTTGGDNDSWEIIGDEVRALICDPPSGTIFGETFISVDLLAFTK